MKARIAFTLVVAAVLGLGLATGSDKGTTINGRFGSSYISHNGGTAYLQICITTPPAENRERQPMNLAVVLDRSGSMADEGKIEYAKKAVRSLMDQLQEGDYFSFVIYDDVVQVLRESRRVSDKRDLRNLLDEVYPRGATNLGGGLVAGLEQVERHRDREYLNRVILLSDGLANRGITSPLELKHIARRYRSNSISVTTMGVGLDYNENLMMGLSQSGGGNYYFIESPNSLASIFRKELTRLSSIAARNASIELTLADGIHVRDVIGCERDHEGKRIKIPLGDLFSGEQRHLTVELEIPEGSGTLQAVKGVLRYEEKRGWFESWPSFSASLHYTRILADVDKNRDNEIQALVDVALSTRSVDKALRALDEGRKDDAARELKAAQSAMMLSPAAFSKGAGGAMLGEQRVRLESFQKLLEDSVDFRKAKKSMQYENYQAQKK
ncbi:MAG: VWA domain-containing protein [Ignavibacteriales bacterium]|nr:VWA domain-containing protein [Ignavibacteriales bacterium]